MGVIFLSLGSSRFMGRPCHSLILRDFCGACLESLADQIQNRKSVGPLEVFAFGGIDADDLAFVDKGRHLDDDAGFEGGGFGDVGG